MGIRNPSGDEFYTRLSDIEYELKNYKPFFKNKRVYCNCDDARWSNFWWYFITNFEHLELKSIDATCYHESQHGEHWKYKGGCDPEVLREAARTRNHELIFPYCEYEVLENEGGFEDQNNIIESIDIVVTNPPFSLFRNFISYVSKKQKQFLVIGPMTAIGYTELFPLIRDNKMWLGYSSPKDFWRPEGLPETPVLTRWFTNLETKKRSQIFECYSRYNENDYPKYDTVDGIEVSKCTEIPCDWTGWMGVPISFLDHYNPKQFEMVGEMVTTKKSEYNFGYPYINGKKKFARLLIRWRPEAMPEIRKGEYNDIIVYN